MPFAGRSHGCLIKNNNNNNNNCHLGSGGRSFALQLLEVGGLRSRLLEICHRDGLQETEITSRHFVVLHLQDVWKDGGHSIGLGL